jgi:cell wall-associated NlpC family hydrolase
VDCSGLAQAVYRTHGILLPRDSDLQATAGEEVDPGRDFSALLPGDLLFFAEEAHRVTHVALSRGGSRIIHASLGNGGVRRNDLLGGTRYEDELRRLFVGARRIV